MRSDEPSGEQTFIEAARQRQLLQATIETIAELGYGRASLARIAQRAGVSKGVITYHFTSKDRLIELVVDHVYASSWAAVQPRVARAGTTVEKLASFVHAEIDYYGSHRQQLLAVGSIVVNHRSADGSLHYSPGAEPSVVRALVQLLREGQERGELHSFDPLPLAVTVDKGITGALEQWATNPEIDLRAYADELARIFEAAVRPLVTEMP